MKIFAVYLSITLTKKPEWFDEFRDKYQGTKILHVTLIQPRYVQEDEIENIKKKIKEVPDTFTFTVNDKKLIFDTLESGQESNGKYLFMLLAQPNFALAKLQRELIQALETYNNYCDELTKEYEANFRPHITIGVNISPEVQEDAKSYFDTAYVCVGEIQELVLPVVKDRSVEEADNLSNLTRFSL